MRIIFVATCVALSGLLALSDSFAHLPSEAYGEVPSLEAPAIGQVANSELPVATEALLRAVGQGQLDVLVRAILRVADRSGEVVAVLPSSGVDTAAASEVRGAKVILHNPQLLSRLRREDANEWGAVFIFAHEVMHHLLGHTSRMTSGELSYPAAEVEANESAGLILARLGAGLNEATGAVKAACRLIKASQAQVEEMMSAVDRGWRRAKNAG